MPVVAGSYGHPAVALVGKRLWGNRPMTDRIPDGGVRFPDGHRTVAPGTSSRSHLRTFGDGARPRARGAAPAGPLAPLVQVFPSWRSAWTRGTIGRIVAQGGDYRPWRWLRSHARPAAAERYGSSGCRAAIGPGAAGAAGGVSSCPTGRSRSRRTFSICRRRLALIGTGSPSAEAGALAQGIQSEPRIGVTARASFFAATGSPAATGPALASRCRWPMPPT